MQTSTASKRCISWQISVVTPRSCNREERHWALQAQHEKLVPQNLDPIWKIWDNLWASMYKGIRKQFHEYIMSLLIQVLSFFCKRAWKHTGTKYAIWEIIKLPLAWFYYLVFISLSCIPVNPTSQYTWPGNWKPLVFCVCLIWPRVTWVQF